MLENAVVVAAKTQQGDIVVVFDEAIYAKAQEILRKAQADTPVKFANVVRLGDFHTLCSLMGVIGKRFADAGLRDLMVEAQIVSDGSVGSVMNGKQYNRAIRSHKIVAEALNRLLWA